MGKTAKQIGFTNPGKTTSLEENSSLTKCGMLPVAERLGE